MYQLSNDSLTVRFDAQGRLVYLENNQNGHGNRVTSPAPDSFKLIYKQGGNWENVVFGSRQTYRIQHSGNKIVFNISGVSTPTGSAKINLTLSASLCGEDLIFGAVIDNQDDVLVTDFFYPQIGIIKSLAGGKPALLWPQQAGEMISNIGDYLADLSRPLSPLAAMKKKSASYSTKLEDGHTLSMTYPGSASMQWMALTEHDQTLYLGVYDQKCHVSELYASGDSADRGAILLGFDRFTFVKTGECRHAPPTHLKLYTGSWHHGASTYRDWFNTWHSRHNKPQWIRDMLGYFLVINKQQYGHEMWPYETLPQLYEYAKAHGCDTLGLFGWYESGHDNQYPDLAVSRSLGGKEKLKANIKTVQEKGGHVTLYVQGHLIDVNSDFYKNGGNRFESKSLWGVPYYEQYNKYHDSNYLKRFTRKTFANACPSCPEWQQLMCTKAEFVASFGPDGVLYDQIGGVAPYPCFDDKHPHMDGNPSLAMSQGRIALLKGIQQTTKQLDSEYGFLTEHITDVYAAHLDALHGINSLPSAAGDRSDVYTDPSRCATINYPELFRFCFPDVIITIRNKAPYMTPRFTNYAFVFGFRFELEIRYRNDCEDIKADRWPAWRAYAAAVSDLRIRHRPILFYGDYVDEQFFINNNPHIITKAYRYENQLAITCWNDTATTQPLGLQAHGYCLKEWATIAGTHEQMPGQIDAQQVGLAIFEREV